jgi:ubiquinone/menaquinone biosynthesis C-methylase UbiE
LPAKFVGDITAMIYLESILDRLHLREGLSVLDVGCGTGADVIDIAQRVGSSGSVIRVDISEAMITEAQRRN